MTKQLKKVLISFILIILPMYANAYIGPGPASTFVSASIGWICAIVFSLIVVLSWPLRILYRKVMQAIKGPKNKEVIERKNNEESINKKDSAAEPEEIANLESDG